MKKIGLRNFLKGLSYVATRTEKAGVSRMLLLLLLMSLFQFSFAQTGYERPRVVTGELIRVIPSLRDFTPGTDSTMITRTAEGLIAKKSWVNPTVDFGTSAKGDPVVQVNNKKLSNTARTSPEAGTEVMLNFDGMGYTSVAPADPTMTAGPGHIIQMINGGSGAYFKVWDRSGVQVVAQTYMDALAGAGYSGAGDPVALYDQFADRYMLTEFGFSGGVTSFINTLIVAVSQTNDPAGAWYIYRFQDNSFFVDYPHWSIWPGAVYATSNDFNTSGTAYLGSSLYAINKAKMLTGDPTAELIRTRLTSSDNKFISMAPVNITGPTAPAAGSPGMFMYFNDDNYTASGTDVDSLGFITMQPNFTTPASTVITFTQQVAVAPFKSRVCASRNCIPSGGAGYDALSDRIMNRIQYRNFGAYEAIVLNHTVDANYPGTAKAGLRWYELRRSGGNWSVFQQSTFAPDGDHRWMGSVNINSKGQIALAYNHSGAGKYASIYFSGRNAADPPGTMPIADILLHQGTAYGTFSNRWGDYNDLVNDVVNDSIFWFTAMYGSGSSSWSTRISNFKLGLCAPSVNMALTQGGTVSVPEGGSITYTNTVNAVCDPITGYTLTDTLPTTVTWVSGGSYNPANRVVTFNPVDVPADASQTYSYTVNVNAGTYFPPSQHINDAANAIAPNWTAATTGAGAWSVSTAAFRSAPSSFFSNNVGTTSDQTLFTTGSFALSNNPSATHSLSFWHIINSEASWDGGVVEISTNNGATWTDLGPYMSGFTYNGTLNSSLNPLTGRQAFTGNSGSSFLQTRINLNSFAGQTVKIRFRFGSDGSVSATGWYVDDILLESAPVIPMRTSLFNASNVRIAISDTITRITQPVCVTPPVVNAPTVTQPTCAGQLTGSIVVDATGVDVLEYSLDGTTWQTSNTFNNLAAGSYNIQVRLQSNTYCLTAYSGNPVVINPLAGTPVVSAPTVTQPFCPVLTGTIVVNATGTGTLEYSVNNGSTWQTSNTFAGLAPGNYNIVVREQSTPGCSTVYSGNPVTINTVIPPQVVNQPASQVICQNGNTTFTITDNAPIPAPTYQWQVSTNGGATWTNLANVAPFSGVTTTTLTVTGAGLVYNGNLFRCAVTNICGTTNSNSASLTVNPLPVVNAGPSGLCAPVTVIASGSANTWSWSPATGLNTTTGTTVIATPVVSTVYTVTGTITATGCTNTASVTVLGTPVTPVITPAAPVICAGTIQPLTVAPTTFSAVYTGSAISVPSSGNATPYPAPITVTGLPTSGVRVKSITLNGVSHTFPGDLDILVQSPTGTNVIVMSDAGGGTDLVNVNLTFDDAAASLLPATIVSGTYRPTNAAGPDNFPAPGPGSITQVNPPLSGFGGNFNGDWKLFVVDDAGGDLGSITSWSIVFEVPTAVWSPATGLFTDANATNAYVAGTPASTVYFRQSPTTTTQYTYTVNNVLGTCSSGPASVTVTVNPLPVVSVSPNAQCGPVTLNATATPTTGVNFSWSPAAGLSSTTGASVTANPDLNTTYTVTGTIAATGCTATATALVNATPAAPVVSPSSVNICLGSTTTLTVTPVTKTSPAGGAIAIPAGAPVVTASGVAGPYPAAITVGGLPASGVRVKSVQLNGLNHTWPSDLDILLQAPNGSHVILMSDRGGSTDIINASLVFDDAALIDLPNTAITSGTYRPTNVAAPDNFTAPGPGAVNQINPRLANFSGNFNGDWKLYIVDQFSGDVGSISSWSITFEVTGAVWTPVTGLFTDPVATVPYVAGTMAGTVYAKPTTTTTYSVSTSTATCNSPVTNVTVTVFQPAAITTQPANVTLCAGANAVFSVVATGSNLAYQWQLSTDNGTTWTNISGANAASYTVANTTTSLSGRRYRVLITNTCNTVTSNAATLTVNALTPVTATDLFNQRICISDTLVPLTGSPVGGSWSGIGVSGFNFIPGATAVGTYVLTYSYTNAAGCTSTDTTTVKVVDCPERIRQLRENGVIVYPNPNSGQFYFRMNSVLYDYLAMKVYTTGGQLVHTQQWKGLVYGRVVPINLTHLPAGTYMVRFMYDGGARTSEKTFRVVVGGQ